MLEVPDLGMSEIGRGFFVLMVFVWLLVDSGIGLLIKKSWSLGKDLLQRAPEHAATLNRMRACCQLAITIDNLLHLLNRLRRSRKIFIAILRNQDVICSQR